MKTLKYKVRYLEDGVFLVTSDDERLMIIDSRKSDERKFFSPMELLLIAAAGCTAIDIVSILKKMRIEFNRLEVEISGERREDYPKVYKKLDISYHVKGKGVKLEKVKKAVELSLTKYCSASITLKKAGAEVSYEIEVEE